MTKNINKSKTAKTTKNVEIIEIADSKVDSQIIETSGNVEISNASKNLADKLVTAKEKTFVKQEETKVKSAQTVLDKFYESDEEYDARIELLRKQDIIKTRQLKLYNVNIPDHRTIWASTDPKAHPSIIDLKKRGYRAVKGHELVPTGHNSVEGAGFHILMAIPEDIAKKRELAIKEMNKQDMDLVKKNKTNLFAESDKDFMFEQNKFEKPKLIIN